MGFPLVAAHKKELGLCTFGKQATIGLKMFVNVVFPVGIFCIQFFAFQRPEAKGALNSCLTHAHFRHWWILKFILLGG